MTGWIRQEDIAAVRERSPILDVVGEHLELRPAGGGNFKGLCPFHEEKTPSFNVTPGVGLFHCFSCQAGGDVILFVMKLEALQFGEAVERLAARCGVELRYEGGERGPGQERGGRARLVEANTAAQEFYAGHLASTRLAREFLAQRGFGLDDAQAFGMGYSPAARDELTRHLRGRGFTDDELTRAGLARKSGRGPLTDVFRGRMMWPVRDLSGDTIAFGGRNPEADGTGPGYLYTPETSLFRKGSVLYGADLARRGIARERKAVIVEGCTDVMACHLSGVTTAVAACGTAFGEEHAKLLRRLIADPGGPGGEVIFVFGAGPAGQKAALRALALEDKLASHAYAVVGPGGLGPCDLRLSRGAPAVRGLAARRVPLPGFVIEAVLDRHDLGTPEGLRAAVDEAAALVARARDPGKWARYAAALDRRLGFNDEKYILDRVRRAGGEARAGEDAAGRPDGPGAAPPAGACRYDRSDPALQAEREALKLAVQCPALCGPDFDALGTGAFAVPVHGSVAGLIAGAGGTASAGRPREWAAALLESAPDGQARRFVNGLAVEPLQAGGEPDGKRAAVILARVAELAAGRTAATTPSGTPGRRPPRARPVPPARGPQGRAQHRQAPGRERDC